jgi:hypothetical protein
MAVDENGKLGDDVFEGTLEAFWEANQSWMRWGTLNMIRKALEVRGEKPTTLKVNDETIAVLRLKVAHQSEEGIKKARPHRKEVG